MLLRRITEHVKAQNWTAVALDFFIVVVGILIAFRITELSEARQETKEERVALERLQLESQEAVRYFQGMVAEHAELNAKRTEAIAALTAGSLEGFDRDRVEDGVFTLGRYPAIAPNRSTYDEMRRQGFPRSRDVVDAVEGYLAQNATLSVTNVLPGYRSRVRQLIPFDAQDFYWEHCYVLNDGAETYVLDCPKGISDEAAAQAITRIADTPDIRLLLTEWAGLNSATPTDLAEQNKAAQRALAVIEEELARRQ
jgi:hypothetical protein